MILDTDCWSRLIRRHANDQPLREVFVGLLRRKQRFFFSAVTMYELSKWMAGHPRTSRHGEYARQLMELRSRFPVLDLVESDAEEAGRFAFGLKMMGQTVGDADCLIAGQAAARQIPLATYNLRHFRRFLALDAEALDLRDPATFERVQPEAS